jgi:hypothetical protein
VKKTLSRSFSQNFTIGAADCPLVSDMGVFSAIYTIRLQNDTNRAASAGVIDKYIVRDWQIGGKLEKTLDLPFLDSPRNKKKFRKMPGTLGHVRRARGRFGLEELCTPFKFASHSHRSSGQWLDFITPTTEFATLTITMMPTAIPRFIAVSEGTRFPNVSVFCFYRICVDSSLT